MDMQETIPTLTSHIHRQTMTWVWALVGALILNLGLFGLFPRLLDRQSEKPVFEEPYRLDTFIRVKRPDNPIKKKEPVKKETRKPDLKQKARVMKRVAPTPMPKNLPPLPFELNTKLPANAIASLHVPLMATQMGDLNLSDIYGVGDIDSPLTVLVRIPPVYPMRAQRRGIKGAVTVRFVVNENGLVENVTIVKADPENVFEKSVIQCVSSWRFNPGTVEGMPVKTMAETIIRFNLDG